MSRTPGNILARRGVPETICTGLPLVFIPIPGVDIPNDHKIVTIGQRLRLWSKTTLKDARFTAQMIVGFSWILLVLLLLPLAHFVSPFIPVILVLVIDVALRMWRVKSTIFFIPVFVWCVAFGVLLLLDYMGRLPG